MTRPVRLQLSREKGFRLQEMSLATNGLPAINVARPSKWGNPFTTATAIDAEFATKESAPAFVVECFLDWLRPAFGSGRDWWQGPESDRRRKAIWSGIGELRGKNLACWCPLPMPGEADICHARVLLETANGPPALAPTKSEVER